MTDNFNIPNIDKIRQKHLYEKLSEGIKAQEFYKLLKIKILNVASKNINEEASKGYTTVGLWKFDGIEKKDQCIIPQYNNGLNVLPIWEECKLELEKEGYKVKLEPGFNYSVHTCYLRIYW